MSARRPFCLWVTPRVYSPSWHSYALPERYGSLDAAERALKRRYPTGRTLLGDHVRAGHTETGPTKEDQHGE